MSDATRLQRFDVAFYCEIILKSFLVFPGHRFFFSIPGMLALFWATGRNVFDSGGAFERTELQHFDVRLRQSQAGGGLTYRKIEEKTAGEHVAVMCGQCLHEAFYPLARLLADDAVDR